MNITWSVEVRGVILSVKKFNWKGDLVIEGGEIPRHVMKVWAEACADRAVKIALRPYFEDSLSRNEVAKKVEKSGIPSNWPHPACFAADAKFLASTELSVDWAHSLELSLQAVAQQVGVIRNGLGGGLHGETVQTEIEMQSKILARLMREIVPSVAA